MEDIPIRITVDIRKFKETLQTQLVGVGHCETCKYYQFIDGEYHCKSGTDYCDYDPTDKLIEKILMDCTKVEDGGKQ